MKDETLTGIRRFGTDRATGTRTRSALTFAGVCCCALAVAQAPGMGSELAPPNPRHPNILIVLADDMGWSDASFRGSAIPTPNIDRLAAEGVELRRFYTNPKCSPTRAAILTGRDPLKLGLSYATVYPWSAFGVAPSEHFMGESFQAQGYQTAMIGKWHLGHAVPAHHPNHRGFDYFMGSLNTGGDYFSHVVQRGFDLQRNGVSTLELAGHYNTDVYTDETVRWIRERRDASRPFLLYLAYKAPHSPFQAPEDLIDEYGDVYTAMMVSMDTGIGRVLDALHAEGVANDTIVLFLSDNGATRGNGSNAPLRGHKLETYEGGIRVLALLRWPGVLPAATVSSQVITSMDVFPTLAAAAGVNVLAERDLDGRNLWRTIERGRAEPRRDDVFYASENFVGRQFSFAVIRGPMKLVQRVSQTWDETTVVNELYDIVADPTEAEDLAEKNPRLVRALANALSDWRREHPYAGSHTRLVPHPGWRGPLDWAKAMELAGENADQDPDDNLYGMGRQDNLRSAVMQRLLDRMYGERGRLIYD